MWVKVCGMCRVEDAAAAVAFGPDAVGLNFYAPSPRHVSLETAVRIVAQLRETIEPVGVFVNHTLDEIAAAAEQCSLRGVQLHGDEPVALLGELRRRLPACRIVRAVRISGGDAGPLVRCLAECQRAAILPDAVLVDARVEGRYGGTGETVAWESLSAAYRADWPPLILAGGLTPDNVAEAVAAVRPWGVDTASGVESEPGRKDPVKVEQFIRNARRAFAAILAGNQNDG